ENARADERRGAEQMQRLVDPAVVVVAMIVPTLHTQRFEEAHTGFLAPAHSDSTSLARSTIEAIADLLIGSAHKSSMEICSRARETNRRGEILSENRGESSLAVRENRRHSWPLGQTATRAWALAPHPRGSSSEASRRRARRETRTRCRVGLSVRPLRR